MQNDDFMLKMTQTTNLSTKKN